MDRAFTTCSRTDGISRRPPGTRPSCEDLAEQSVTFAQAQLTEQARAGRFDPAQRIAEHAPAIQRLVAFLGRPVNTGC
jgi:hypothetical protein